MNAGFSSLAYLKSQLLAEALRDGSSYDAALLQLGLGVAATFENYCQRPFTRTEAYEEILPADRCEFLLSLLPVEQVTKIELKLTEADGWVEQTINEYVRTIDLRNGIVFLPSTADAGPYYAQLRFTYTGGYWWDTSEENTGTRPTGASALPEDLRHAWILQCKEVWNQSDRLGTGITATPDKSPTFKSLDLVPQVKLILGDYIRFNNV